MNFAKKMPPVMSAPVSAWNHDRDACLVRTQIIVDRLQFDRASLSSCVHHDDVLCAEFWNSAQRQHKYNTSTYIFLFLLSRLAQQLASMKHVYHASRRSGLMATSPIAACCTSTECISMNLFLCVGAVNCTLATFILATRVCGDIKK